MLGRGAYDTRSTLSCTGRHRAHQTTFIIFAFLVNVFPYSPGEPVAGTRSSRVPDPVCLSLGDQMPEPPSTKPPSASYLSRIRRSFGRSSPGVSALSEPASSFSCPLRNLRAPRATAPAAQVVKVHASKPASGKQTAERQHPPSSLLDRAAAKVQVAWRAQTDSKAQVTTQGL